MRKGFWLIVISLLFSDLVLPFFLFGEKGKHGGSVFVILFVSISGMLFKRRELMKRFPYLEPGEDPLEWLHLGCGIFIWGWLCLFPCSLGFWIFLFFLEQKHSYPGTPVDFFKWICLHFLLAFLGILGERFRIGFFGDSGHRGGEK